jgi:nucleoside-diphosphate-sugar epimerase
MSHCYAFVVRVLVIGPGYVGSHLARELKRSGHQVAALGRTSMARQDLRDAGIQALNADITKPASLEKVPSQWDWVVNCVSSSRGTMEEYRAVYLEGMRNLLGWLTKSPLQKFVYTSSTGVYGQNDGSVVTETSSAIPESETGSVLIESENRLLAAARQQNFPSIILRVSGIYGPNRGYWLKQFQSGEARLDGTGQRILNMVHRDDVVGAIIAALERGESGQVYNVTDDESVAQIDLFKWLSEKLGKPMPAAAEPGATSSRKRSGTSKRVSNTRLKTELGYRLKYPTFREGFLALGV